jgi:hypothetical protein
MPNRPKNAACKSPSLLKLMGATTGPRGRAAKSGS